MANSYNTIPIVINTVMTATALTGGSQTGSTVTVTTGSTTGLTSNTGYVSIYGCTPSGYNGTWPVGTVVANTSFTFTYPFSPALGNMSVDGNWVQSWKNLQTLNVGYQPSTLQQTSGQVFRQSGLVVTSVLWSGATASGHTFDIIDPQSGNQLLSGVAGNTLIDVQYLFDNAIDWRDFAVIQISSGSLLINYR